MGRICAKTIEALGVIREKVRMLSLTQSVVDDCRGTR